MQRRRSLPIVNRRTAVSHRLFESHCGCHGGLIPRDAYVTTKSTRDIHAVGVHFLSYFCCQPTVGVERIVEQQGIDTRFFPQTTSYTALLPIQDKHNCLQCIQPRHYPFPGIGKSTQNSLLLPSLYQFSGIDAGQPSSNSALTTTSGGLERLPLPMAGQGVT